MIYIVEDNAIMADCIEKAAKCNCRKFSNGIEAMSALEDELPELIFLDILLDGPNGFTFLNELMSYSDTAKIPIVIISSLDFAGKDLSSYGVVGYLNKDTMLPQEIRDYVVRYTH